MKFAMKFAMKISRVKGRVVIVLTKACPFGRLLHPRLETDLCLY